MTSNDIIALIITGALGLAVIVASIFLLAGRGTFLIAGYNTMSKTEKEKHDTKALCRFMGKILLPIGALTPMIAIGGIFNISWISWVYIAAVLGLAIFAVIYANTGNRFRK